MEEHRSMVAEEKVMGDRKRWWETGKGDGRQEKVMGDTKRWWETRKG